MDWFWKAMVAMVCFIPIFILTPFLHKNFSVRPEATLVWWTIGIAIGTSAVMQGSGESAAIAFTRYTAIVFLLGLTLGTLGNLSVFGSLVTAPNPGLSIAVVNINAIVTFVVMIWLGTVLPQHFVGASFNYWHFVGILLTIAGVVIIATK